MRVMMIFPYVTYSDVLVETYPLSLSRLGDKIVISTIHIEDISNYIKQKKEIMKSLKFRFVNAFNFKLHNIQFPIHFSIKKNILEEQPDIIHINNLPFFTTFQYVYAAHELSIPSLVHVHGVLGTKNWFIDALQKAFLYTFGRVVFSKATCLLCLTPEDAAEIIKFGCPPSKIKVIPNGVDTEKFKPMNLKKNPNQLYWGGRFVPQKGLTYLLEAMKIVKNSKVDVLLIMTGDGPLLRKVQKNIKDNKLSDNIHLLGKIPRDKIPEIINSSSIYVLPSLKEGMPYALLEAMACGAPVIASKIPGISNIITNMKDGILVPPKNAESLAKNILFLLNNNKLQIQMGKEARHLMMSKFSWPRIASSLKDIYSELVHTKMRKVDYSKF